MTKDGFYYIPKNKNNNKDKYTKLSKLEEGDNKIRIIEKPVFFWQYWEPILDSNGKSILNEFGMEKGKPIRFPCDQKPPQKEVQYFMSAYIWDYYKKEAFIINIEQTGVLNKLKELQEDHDFGDLINYDLKINKTGKLKNTKYSIVPLPPKPFNDDILKVLKDHPVNMSALVSCKDPWNDLEGDVNEMTGEIAWPKISEIQSAQLDQLLLKLNDEGMKEFICKRASVTSIYDLPLEKFSGVIGYLEEQIKLRKGKNE